MVEAGVFVGVAGLRLPQTATAVRFQRGNRHFKTANLLRQKKQEPLAFYFAANVPIELVVNSSKPEMLKTRVEATISVSTVPSSEFEAVFPSGFLIGPQERRKMMNASFKQDSLLIYSKCQAGIRDFWVPKCGGRKFRIAE